MKPVTCLFAILTMGAMLCLPAMAQEKGPSLDLQDSLRLAYLNNPVLRAARSELLSTQELLPQAQAGYKPTISSDLGITGTDVEGSNFGGGGETTSKDVGLSLNQPLYRGGKTTAEAKAARLTISAQEAVLHAREQEVLRDAATAYADVYRDEALLSLALNNRDVIERQLEAATQRFEVGELTRTDVSQSQSRLAEAEAGIISARGDMRASHARFEKLVGMLPGHLQKPHIRLKVPNNLQTALSVADEQNPRIVAADYSYQAAEEDVDGIWAELLPEAGFFTSWDRTYDPSPGLIDEQTTKAIGVSATIPLYQAGGVRSRVRQAKHDANRRYLEILDVRREIRREATANWEDLQAARAEIRSRLAQVEAAKIAQQGVHAETEFGSRTVLDALDADQELLDARVALVSTQRDEIAATFNLMGTLGLLTPEQLGFPEEEKHFDANLEKITKTIFNTDVDRVTKTE